MPGNENDNNNNRWDAPMYNTKATDCCWCCFLHDVLGGHEQRVDVLEAIELALIDLSDEAPEMVMSLHEWQLAWTRQLCVKMCHVGRAGAPRYIWYIGLAYGLSGVSCTGSSVNSGGKLARSRSLSSLGLYGGGICFCSSWNARRREDIDINYDTRQHCRLQRENHHHNN